MTDDLLIAAIVFVPAALGLLAFLGRHHVTGDLDWWETYDRGEHDL